ncbi:MAG: polymer-forming cytoskeletal protein, partial [Longimicrobiales bacterium]|nr:polymer-forming cytoskeletal protein [Longimicrobiales bacterium]
MTVRGDCVVEGQLRIEGRVHGTVRAGGLVLTKTGSVEGDLIALEQDGGDAFTIAGKVDGEVRAPRVEVDATGSILR